MSYPIHVSLLPAHPDEGSVSMLRYWMAIQEEASKQKEVHFDAPYAMPVFPGRKATRSKRIISRYFTAPLIAATHLPSPLVHILDHSSAHLIPFIAKSKKVVVTLHDLIPLRDHSGLSSAQVERFGRCVRNLAKADHIICDSIFTKNEAIELLGLPSDKMSVVMLGASKLVASGNEEPCSIAKEVVRILSVGSDLPRKNLKILPEVVSGLLARGHRVELWRVGAQLGTETRIALDRLDSNRFKLKEWGSVSDAQLASCYRDSDCVIIPSYLEGFGLPVLEGMEAGCPVISSNAASLPEAGGEAALYFDPDDAEGAVRHIEALKSQPILRQDLIERGLERVKKLTWKSHFDQVKAIYAQQIRVKSVEGLG